MLLTLELCGNRQVECSKHEKRTACEDAGCCNWNGSKCLPKDPTENAICDQKAGKQCDSSDSPDKKCDPGYFCNMDGYFHGSCEKVYWVHVAP